jgi:hypothetical protein
MQRTFRAKGTLLKTMKPRYCRDSLADFPSPCKIFEVHDKTHHFQERAKECFKQSQNPGYFAKIHQEYLSITCMINQDHSCLAIKIKMPWLDKERLTKIKKSKQD